MAPGAGGATGGRGLVVLGLCVAALSHAPLGLAQLLEAADHPAARGGPLAVLGAGLIAARNLRDAGPGRPGRWFLAVPALAAAWGVLLLGCLAWSPWMGAVAGGLALAAISYAMGGGRWLRATAPAALLLAAAAAAPPLGLGDLALDWLTDRVERPSESALDSLKVLHHRQGAILRTPGRALNPRAGSALDNLGPLLTLVAVATLWQRRGPVRLVLRLSIATFWLFVAEVLRRVGVVWLLDGVGIDLTAGRRGVLLGLLVMALVGLATWSTDRLLNAMAMAWRWLTVGPGRPRRQHWLESLGRFWSDLASTLAGPSEANPGSPGTAWVLPALALYGGLLAFQPRLLGPWGRALLADSGPPDWVAAARPDALPERLGDFRREAAIEVPDIQGLEVPRLWLYRRGDRSARVTIRGPFAERPDLSAIAGPDWFVNERAAEPLSDGSVALLEVLGRDDGLHACVGALLVDEAGRPVPPPPPKGGGLLARVRQKAADRSAPPTYQIAAFARSDTALNLQDRRALLRLLGETRRALLDRPGPPGKEERRP